MNIDDLTIREARELARLFGSTPAAASESHPHLGQIVCVETILPWYVGILEAVTPTTYVLRDATWVPDAGRYSDFAAGTAEPNEAEPLPPGLLVVERSAVLSCRRHPALLRVVK